MIRHDPTWLNAGRWGRWCECSCGWKSPNGSPILAQVAFGAHLLTAPKYPTTSAAVTTRKAKP